MRRKRTLNLLPTAERRPMPARKALALAAAALALYAAFVAGIWYLNNSELERLNGTIEELQSRKLRLQKHAAGVQAPARKSVDAAEAEIMGMMRATPPWESILSELSLVVPETVWLELLESNGATHIRIKGYSKTQSDIARLIDGLERSDFFNRIELVYSQKGKETTSFELRAEMTWT